MIKTAYILPTGDELLEGVILDTDSPMIMETLLGLSGSCRVIREEPLADRQQEIVGKIRQCSLKGADLLVFIGGSGGGHRHSPTLGKDFTHSALEECLDCAKAVSLYGKNGHLWSRLVCGFYGKTMVINVPGPYSEAKAAISAFCTAYREAGADMTQISRAMAKAVESQYPQGNLKQSRTPEESLGQSRTPEERLGQSQTSEESPVSESGLGADLSRRDS